MDCYFTNKEFSFYIDVKVEGIPRELIEHGKWCCFKANRTSDKRYTKVPFRPIVGTPANPRKPDTFAPFSEAYEDYGWEMNGYNGIGVLLTGGIALIDLDDSYYNGKLSPLCKRVVDYFDSYTEVSFSGTGIHILIKLDKDFDINKNRYYTKNPYNKMEVYLSDTGRYTTVSGNHLEGTPNEIRNQTRKMKRFLDDFMLREKEIKQKPNRTIDKAILSKVRSISDGILLEKIRNSKAGDKFVSLFDFGSWEDRYNSQSEADLELAGILSFFTCGDFERIEKLMWKSQLSRGKWEQNKNYLKNTINKAVLNCQNFYNPR